MANSNKIISKWVIALAIILGVFTLFFYGLGGFPLLDVDEPVYGQVANEMSISGAWQAWLSPHYLGNLWFDKPPLFYWLSSASFKIFGANEFAARFPSALMALGLLLILYSFVKIDYGKKIAIKSTIILATCIQMIVLAHAAVTDMTFVFCLMLSIYGYRLWIKEDAKSYKWAFLCGAGAGLATLAKGPVAPVLLFTTFVLHLYWLKRIKFLLSWQMLIGIIAFAGVGLPWYILMLQLHGKEFIDGFLVANNLTRFLTAEHQSITGKWYSFFMNIPTLLVFFFPWSLFLPFGIIKGMRSNDGAKLAFIWFIVVFIFFSISKTQLVTYIFPLYPVAAMFVALLWEDINCKLNKVLKPTFFFALLIFVFLAIMAQEKYTEVLISAIIMGAILPISLLISLIMFNKGKRNQSFISLAVGMVAFTCMLIASVMPIAGNRLSAKILIDKIPNSEHSLVSFRNNDPSIYYYTGGFVPNLQKDDLLKQLESSIPVYVIGDVEYSSWMKKYGFQTITNNGKLELYYFPGFKEE